MRVIKWLGCTSGRVSQTLNSFGSGFVIPEGDYNDEQSDIEDLIDKVTTPTVSVPVQPRAARLLGGTAIH